MNLLELVNAFPHRADTSVPDWMLGYFRRRAISFCHGKTDLDTHVSWLQSRNFTIDLRLPPPDDRLPAKPPHTYTREEWQQLADYEGWQADCRWDGRALQWQEGTSLQLHNRWPEPALLHRVGNCMMEFAPGGTYVEDWRLQPNRTGPMIGLRLLDECNPDTDVVYHRGGGLIVCGDYAGLVLGRPETPPSFPFPNALRRLAGDDATRHEELAALFRFETSVATGTIDGGYRIRHSTCPWRVGLPLLSLEDFRFDPDHNTVQHAFDIDGEPRLRTFTIDTLEPVFAFHDSTPCTTAAADWLQQEAPTLDRYARRLT